MKEIMKKKIKYFAPESYQDCISISCPNCIFYNKNRRTVLECVEYNKFSKFKKKTLNTNYGRFDMLIN